MDGRIVDLRRKTCLVDTDQGVIEATLRGTLAKRGRVYVGDLVELSVVDNQISQQGTVVRVHPRVSTIDRPAIANIDQILLTCSCSEPPLSATALDRGIFYAEVHAIQTVVVCNKTDLLADSDREFLHQTLKTYEALGYPTVLTSAREGSGIDQLRDVCKGKVSSMAGVSGVGKSKLMNCLFPDRDFRTGEISRHTERGTHTTTSTTLINLPDGGHVADTPGYSLIDLPPVREEEVAGYFRDLADLAGQCRFNNCIHDAEPGCVVSNKVSLGEIARWRYESYLAICAEMKERRQQQYR